MSSSNFYKRTTNTSVESSSKNDAEGGSATQVCIALMFLIGIGTATLLILSEKGWWSVMILAASAMFCSFMTGDKEEEEDKEEAIKDPPAPPSDA